MKRRTKFFLLRASIIALFAVLAGRLWYVQIVMGSYYQQQGDTSKIRVLPVQADRGLIYDRNGIPLVYNEPSWQVQIVPHGVPAGRGSQIFASLSRLLGGKPTASQIARIVSQHEWQPYAAAVVKDNVSFETALVIKQLHAVLPGVLANPANHRLYQNDSQFSLSHILGYTGAINAQELAWDRAHLPAMRFGTTDEVGQMGLEGSLDGYLHGANGQARVEVDAGERPVRTLSPGRTVAGDSVYLTINSKLQQQVANDVATAYNWYSRSASGAIAVLEDVHSGAILSMVSLPSYDNNAFSQRRHKQEAAILTDSRDPLLDLATAGQFPPGSTYKLITATAALQTGVADVNRIVDDTGQIKLDANTIFHGWAPNGIGPVNVVDAIAKSSDIYFYTVAGGSPDYPGAPYIGPDRLAYWARLYGLGKPTGVGLPGEDAGLVPNKAWHRKVTGRPWFIGDTYNSAIGQGDDLVTPVQMANVVATIANGGIEYHPHVIDQIVGRIVPGKGIARRNRVVQKFAPQVIRKNFIDPSNLALIQEGMRASVTTPETAFGTSFNVADPRLRAAGKTGTAQTGAAADAWWVGYAPYDNPEVAIAVLIPHANAEGAFAAAPLAQKLLQDYFHLQPLKADWTSDFSWYLGATGTAG